MYDLIVKGGTVVDPSQNLHALRDVAIEEGKIAKIAVAVSYTHLTLPTILLV